MLPVVGSSPSSATASTGPDDASSPLAIAPQASSGGGGGKSWLAIAGAVLLGMLALALGGFLAVTRHRRTPG
jgi:hypothetical protein